MSLRNKILGTACALALGAFAAPAYADMTNFDGALGVDYSHLDANQGGGSANAWGGSGSGVFGLGSNFAAEVDGGYHNTSFSGGGGSVNDWNVDGSIFWRGSMGRVGAVVGYNSLDGNGNNLNATNYGGFGEWYAGSAFTVGLKGGGFNASGHTNGEYVGLALTGYATPDIAITGGYDYTHLSHVASENDWSLKGEWLISERTPFALYGAYTNSKFSSGGPTINTWTIGLTYYCDPDGRATLVDRMRGGTAQWGTSFGPTILKF